MNQNKNMQRESKITKFVKFIVTHIEKWIVKILIVLMAILLGLATLELAYKTVVSFLTSDSFLIDINDIMELFGIFLLVLIGIELLDTIKIYLRKNVVHVEVVILVAIIAVARKVIVLDFDKYSGLEIIGIALIIVALSLGYFLIKKAGGCEFSFKGRDADVQKNDCIENVNNRKIKKENSDEKTEI
jgi:uncharacterized membrane protein (DUF373 family)